MSGRGALVVSHPGHELRVYGWLAAARPHAFVLTDGSGRAGRSRLPSTTKVLRQVGARRGELYGRLTDAEAYRAVLDHDCKMFVGLARELAGALVRHRIDYVAGDAAEGYNPSHDVCRLLINAAVRMAGRERGAEIGNFDFPLTGRPGACTEGSCEEAPCLHLDDRTFERKLAAARSYPEMAAEVEAAFAAHGVESFRVESLRPVTPEAAEEFFGAGRQPYYEQYGERQVAAGHYEHVIRLRQHVLPIADALRRAASEHGR